MGVIHYRFKSEKGFRPLSIDGNTIMLLELKNEIAKESNLGTLSDYDLVILNEQTKEVYADTNQSIPKNTSVVVRRVPVNQSKMTKTKTARVIASQEKELQETKDRLMKKSFSDMDSKKVGINVTEEERIAEMITKSSEVFGQQSDIIALNSSSNKNRFKSKGMGNHVPPSNYICFNCGKKGHLLRFCESTEPKAFNKIKKTTGIPRNLLKPLQDSEKKGTALITPEGLFVTAFADDKAWEETLKKERRGVIDSKLVPDEFKCLQCKKNMNNPVLFSCCSSNSCEDCVKDIFINSFDVLCPFCKNKIKPSQLRNNKELKEKFHLFNRNYLVKDKIKTTSDDNGAETKKRKAEEENEIEKKTFLK